MQNEIQFTESEKPWYWEGGGEATLLRPVFSQASGLLEMASDGATREDFRAHDLRFDRQAGYRVWLGIRSADLGVRASFWSLDSASDPLSLRPSASGFGRVDTPSFGDIDVSSTIPSEELRASGSILARTALAEVVHFAQWNAVHFDISGGIETSQLRSTFLAELNSDQVGPVGSIDYQRRLDGIGPTFSGLAHTPVLPRLSAYVGGRTSLLFGRSTSHLRAGEDLDLNPSFTTTFPHEADNFLLRMEGGTGLRAILMQRESWSCDGWIGLQAQQWIGAGSLHSIDGSMGFVGIHLGASFLY